MNISKRSLFIIPLITFLISSCSNGASSSSYGPTHTGRPSTSESSTTQTSTSSSSSSSSSASSSTTSYETIDKQIEDIVKNGYNAAPYYQGISDSLSGNNLKNALTSLISSHTKLNYDNLEDYMRITDRDWERSPIVSDSNPYVILLYYTQNDNDSMQQLWNHYHTLETKFGIPESQQSWDKEHIWAKSNGFPSSGQPAYSDLHHLRASDRKNNNTRSSLPFADVISGASNVNDFSGTPSGKKGTNNGTSVYEPYSIYKGDVARALLYMATCYSSMLSLTTGKDSSGGKWGFLSTLLKWNLEDAPDEFEIRRNSLVQLYQGNRNPFIDHPEYACRIYSTGDSSIKSVCGF